MAICQPFSLADAALFPALHSLSNRCYTAHQMTAQPSKQKLYCFVDETGQDDRSKFFIVVTVISSDEVDQLRSLVARLEKQSKVGSKKWHKLRSPERETFLELVLRHQTKLGQVFFGQYEKPLPFFLPMLETLTKAILSIAQEEHQVVVYVDGIDKKKSHELTNALRLKGVKTKLVRSARDESEPLIRLADRWAGCIRDGIEGLEVNQAIVTEAITLAYLIDVEK